jgi:hypothetical protein
VLPQRAPGFPFQKPACDVVSSGEQTRSISRERRSRTQLMPREAPVTSAVLPFITLCYLLLAPDSLIAAAGSNRRRARK